MNDQQFYRISKMLDTLIAHAQTAAIFDYQGRDPSNAIAGIENTKYEIKRQLLDVRERDD